MKITRRDFLKTAFWSVAGLLGSSFPRSLSGLVNNAPNVIILVFDSLSARHLSFLGYPRATTPNLTRFAEKATVYHRHYAAGNFTSPGTASLLTGMYPWTHRAFEQAGLVSRKLADQNLFGLVDRSYQKAAFAQNLWADLFLFQFQHQIDVHLKSTSYSLANDLRYNDALWQKDSLTTFRAYEDFLEQDFGVPGSLYFSFLDKVKSYLRSEFNFTELKEDYPRGIPNFVKYKLSFVLEQVFEGMEQEIARLQNPFVGYFHFWPPHEPYSPNRRFIGMFDDDWVPAPKPFHPLASRVPEAELNRSRRQYDEYIANVDESFGQLYDRLQRAGFLENSYLMVTADHGQFFERGVNGHVTPLLYDPVLHVPLIVSTPGQSQRRDVYSPTSCVDLVPTILKITGSSLLPGLEGNLLPGFGGDDPSERAVFAMEAKKNPSFQPITTATLAMIKGVYKLIWYIGYMGYHNVYELYNLKSDPEELTDLSKSHPEILLPMAEELTASLALADLL
jgi:arylsulfatase A-like enzyme